jgi:agmatine/peptidylarginine deiminase
VNLQFNGWLLDQYLMSLLPLLACACRTLLGMNWQFNGWGGLYGSYEQDKLVAAKVCEAEGLPYVSTDFVLEGGSIHVDGEG